MRIFTRHPASVGESYWGHMAVAFGFGARLLGASVACFVHGVLPFMFERTASREIGKLHKRMVLARSRACRVDTLH